MSKVKDLMINTYCVNGIDFMGYKLQKGEKFTYHHIVKREHGGGKNLKNGAILTKQAHRYLHIVECKDYGTYLAINKVLKLINESKEPPREEYLALIDKLLTDFETSFKSSKNAKNEPIVKEKYKRRVQNERKSKNIH